MLHRKYPADVNYSRTNLEQKRDQRGILDNLWWRFKNFPYPHKTQVCDAHNIEFCGARGCEA